MTYLFNECNQNITIKRRETAVIPLNFNIDITDMTVVLAVKSSLTDTSYIINVENSQHIDAVNGETQIVISTDAVAGQNSDVPAGSYVYGIMLVTYVNNVEVVRNTILPRIDRIYSRFIVEETIR